MRKEKGEREYEMVERVELDEIVELMWLYYHMFRWLQLHWRPEVAYCEWDCTPEVYIAGIPQKPDPSERPMLDGRRARGGFQILIHLLRWTPCTFFLIYLFLAISTFVDRSRQCIYYFFNPDSSCGAHNLYSELRDDPLEMILLLYSYFRYKQLTFCAVTYGFTISPRQHKSLTY